MCAWETHQGCPAPIKSSVFRTEGSENLHSGRIFRPLCTFPLSTERYTPALPVQRPKLSTFMELPAYRVVIMPYGVHERLRSHRGVDLTGKPRDLAFAYHHYRTNWKGCQGAMSPSRPACGRGLGGQKGDGQSPSPQRVKKVFSPPRGAGIHRRPSRFPCALRPEIGGLPRNGLAFSAAGGASPVSPSWVSRAHSSLPLRRIYHFIDSFRPKIYTVGPVGIGACCGFYSCGVNSPVSVLMT